MCSTSATPGPATPSAAAPGTPTKPPTTPGGGTSSSTGATPPKQRRHNADPNKIPLEHDSRLPTGWHRKVSWNCNRWRLKSLLPHASRKQIYDVNDLFALRMEGQGALLWSLISWVLGRVLTLFLGLSLKITIEIMKMIVVMPCAHFKFVILELSCSFFSTGWSK